MNISLEIEQLEDGRYLGDAPWLEAAVYGDTFESVYWEIVRLKNAERQVP